VRTLKRKLILAVILIFLVISFGTVGYMSIEKWGFLDALYMTVITLTTVGYEEIHRLSTSGRIFTIILAISGVGTVLYTLGIGAQFVLEGEIQQIFRRKRLEKKLEELKDHYIICGYGRMGKIIAKELLTKYLNIVVIEKLQENFHGIEDFLVIEGDATKDDVLRRARIERARCLISVLPTDAENLFVVLSARVLNPNLLIVARAGEEGSEQKLIRAGADKALSPYHFGGIRIAQTVLKPAVMDFIEFATKSGNIELQMEEIPIREGSKLAGLTLNECGIGRELGVIIVAIKHVAGEMRFNPTFLTEVQVGDTLIAVGESSKLRTLEEMATGK
jgi:voltage-gated potassium channel